MKCKILFPLVAIAGLLAGQTLASTANVGTYNLILKNDLDTSSDIEGALFIGGDINMSGRSLDVGNELPADVSVNAVTVVGDITANDVKSGNGDIVYGGNIGSTNLINNGVGSAYQETQSSLQSEFDTIWASVEADSAYYAGLEKNADITGDSNNPRFGPSTATDLTVYELTSTELQNQNASYAFLTNPDVPVLINVDLTGLTSLEIKAKSSIQLSQYSFVLWNFYSTDETVTDLSFNGDGWRGSILAPYANISSNTGALEGGVAALSYTGSVELHNNLYTYEPPTEEVEVNAPASAFLLGFGLLLVAARRFKK